MAQTLKILVVGRSGQVAQALANAVWPRLSVEVQGRESIDLCQPSSVANVIAGGRWGAVVNAAAFTAVDRAEAEPDMAFAVNRDGPAALAAACAEAGIPLIHLSTDYVFDGTKTEPYSEDDPVNPLSIYGASKAEGEAAVRAQLDAHVIMRTSWVFSATGSNFVKTMLRLAAERTELSIVDDQRGCPSAAHDIASAIVRVTSALIEGKRDGFGTLHFAGAGPTTWHGFACEIFRQAALRGHTAPRRLKAISTSAYPTPARRPANSTLDTARITQVYGIEPRPWAEGLSETLDTLLGPAEAHTALRTAS